MIEVTREVERARDIVASAERIVVLTGAGVSAESGVPTFRGPQGLWKSHRPEDLATPEAFARDPRLVWEWYAWRRGVVGGCMPNPAHVALARLALRSPGRVTIVTQNVDGLHDRAAREAAAVGGASSGDPASAFALEVHGQLQRDRCPGCERRSTGSSDVDTTSLKTLPRCSGCGSLLRPDVVWFGEALDGEVIGASFDAAREADVCLVVGTSALVYPAASIPDVTSGSGGLVVEVNLEPTPLSGPGALSLFGAAGAVLPQLLSRLV